MLKTHFSTKHYHSYEPMQGMIVTLVGSNIIIKINKWNSDHGQFIYWVQTARLGIPIWIAVRLRANRCQHRGHELCLGGVFHKYTAP